MLSRWMLRGKRTPKDEGREGKALYFNEDVVELDAGRTTPAGPKPSVRTRVNTGFRQRK